MSAFFTPSSPHPQHLLRYWVVDQPPDVRYFAFFFKRGIIVLEFIAILSCLTAINVFLVGVVSESYDSKPNNASSTKRQLVEEPLSVLELKEANCSTKPEISPYC